MKRYLVSYDIAGSSGRNMVARRLEKEGQRIQKSVFLVQSSPENFLRLVQDLLEMVGSDDSLLCLPVCDSCFAAGLLAGPTVPLIGYF